MAEALQKRRAFDCCLHTIDPCGFRVRFETNGYIAAETRYASAFHEQNRRAAQGLRSAAFQRMKA
jgi:hypothetical protein